MKTDLPKENEDLKNLISQSQDRPYHQGNKYNRPNKGPYQNKGNYKGEYNKNYNKDRDYQKESTYSNKDPMKFKNSHHNNYNNNNPQYKDYIYKKHHNHPKTDFSNIDKYYTGVITNTQTEKSPEIENLEKPTFIGKINTQNEEIQEHKEKEKDSKGDDLGDKPPVFVNTANTKSMPANDVSIH